MSDGGHGSTAIVLTTAGGTPISRLSFHPQRTPSTDVRTMPHLPHRDEEKRADGTEAPRYERWRRTSRQHSVTMSVGGSETMSDVPPNCLVLFGALGSYS